MEDFNTKYNGEDSFVFLRLGEVLGEDATAAEKQPGEDWVVDKLFGVESVNLVVGDAGSKKTFSMMDLAMCVCMGKEWMGRKTLKTGVLWVDEESGERRMRQRLAVAAMGHSAPEDVPFYFSSIAGYDLGNSRDVSGIADRAREYGCGLIVVDSLVGAMGGVDENSFIQLGGMFRMLRWLNRQTMAAVVLIHHINKAGVFRGSASFKGYVDVMMNVESGAHTNLVVFDTVKGRDAERQRFAGRFNFEEEKVWMEETNLAEAALRVRMGDNLSPGARFVLVYLQTRGPSQRYEIMNDAPAGVERKQVRRAVYWLVDQGVIERVNGGKQGAGAIYGLVG